MALLVVEDDGGEGAETIRLRGPRFVIGRTSGDLVIPHDGAISGQHAEIVLRAEAGGHLWYLVDLKSQNGTFLRFGKTRLKMHMEFLLGGYRYRFDLPPNPSAGSADLPAATRKWQVGGEGPVASPFRPALVEQGTSKRYEIATDDVWIGRDPGLSAIVIDDPMLSPRHAHIHRDEHGRWHMTENSPTTRNRIWIRSAESPLPQEAQFQCGEQRFRFKVL